MRKGGFRSEPAKLVSHKMPKRIGRVAMTYTSEESRHTATKSKPVSTAQAHSQNRCRPLIGLSSRVRSRIEP